MPESDQASATGAEAKPAVILINGTEILWLFTGGLYVRLFYSGFSYLIHIKSSSGCLHEQDSV